jgi:DNA repair exonuclease SbcCD ATPase subunit
MDFPIDRAVALDVPTRFRPDQDSLNALSAKFENLTQSNQTALAAFRDKISEISCTVNSLNERVSDDREKIHDITTSIARESSKVREVTENCLSRIQALESRFAQLEESVRGLYQIQQQSEEAIGEQIVHLSSNLSHTTSKSAERDEQIMVDVERLNRKSQSTFAQMSQQLQAVVSGVSGSVADLAAATRSAFDILRVEHENDVSMLVQQLEKSTSDTSQAIGQLEAEVAQTFGGFCALVTAIEGSCSAELSLAKRSSERLCESFSRFSTAMVEKLATNTRALDRIDQGVRANVGALCNAFLSTWKGDLSSFLRDVSSQVTECQAKTGTIEQRLAEHVIAVGKRQDEIIGLLNQKVKIPVNSSDLEDRIGKLEQLVFARAQKMPRKSVNPQRKGQFRPPQVANPMAPGSQSVSGTGAQSDGDPVPDDASDAADSVSVNADQVSNDPDDVSEVSDTHITPGSAEDDSSALREDQRTMVQSDLDLFADVEPSLMPCEFPDDVIAPTQPKAPRGPPRRRGRR